MTIINSHATTPEIRSALNAVLKYLETNTHSLSQAQKETGAELIRRIKRLENDCNKLIKINNLLLDSDGIEVTFDQPNDTLNFSHKGHSLSIKINRADPATPISIPTSTATSGYKAGTSKKESDTSQVDKLKMEMEQLLEHYYSNAFRITKLVQQVTNQKKFQCTPITMVRNKLIEHPDTGSIYSFGFGSNGPILKPTQSGTIEWTDAGLVPNTIELVASLNSMFRESA